MSCINPNTPEYKKLLTELKNPLLVEIALSKELNIKPGVEELFDENPELASIGTPEQYSQYLDTIFPDSQVKDIVYHGTSGLPFEKFLKDFIGKSRNAITSLEKGFYFTNNKKLSKLTAREYLEDSIIVDGKHEFGVDIFTDYAFKSESEISEIVGYDVFLKKYKMETVKDYLKKTKPEKEYKLEYYKPVPGFKKGIASVILNIKDPFIKDLKGERMLDAIPTEKEYRKILEEASESVIFQNVVDTTRGLKEEYIGNTYVVFEPEQIHILGNKQDIEGFKKFVSGETSSFTPLSSDINTAYEIGKELESMASIGFKNIETVEEALFEVAQQMNSSEFERESAISALGETITNIAIKWFPDAKVGDVFKSLTKENNIDKTPDNSIFVKDVKDLPSC